MQRVLADRAKHALLGLLVNICTMNENYLAMTEGVKEFLVELGLEQYYEIFVTKGFDCESDVNNLQDDDLDAMGISDPNHRQLLLTAGRP